MVSTPDIPSWSYSQFSPYPSCWTHPIRHALCLHVPNLVRDRWHVSITSFSTADWLPLVAFSWLFLCGLHWPRTWGESILRDFWHRYRLLHAQGGILSNWKSRAWRSCARWCLRGGWHHWDCRGLFPSDVLGGTLQLWGGCFRRTWIKRSIFRWIGPSCLRRGVPKSEACRYYHAEQRSEVGWVRLCLDGWSMPSTVPRRRPRVCSSYGRLHNVGQRCATWIARSWMRRSVWVWTNFFRAWWRGWDRGVLLGSFAGRRWTWCSWWSWLVLSRWAGPACGCSLGDY